MVRIFPSLINGDLLRLRDQITSLDPYCAGYHLDLMDGHFVPNITWGPDFINAVARATKRQIWIHMMVTDPGYWYSKLVVPVGSLIDFHIETVTDHQVLSALVASIRTHHFSPGIAICPQTPLENLYPYLGIIDYVLIMSVNPGFSGQSFIPTSIDRIKQLITVRSEKNYRYTIGVDGGINTSTIKQAVDAGAELIAAASAIFSGPTPSIEALKKLTNLANASADHYKKLADQ